MSAPKYEYDLAIHFENQGLGFFNSPTPTIYCVPEIAATPTAVGTEVASIFVVPYAGAKPKDWFATNAGNAKEWQGRVQVRYRAPPRTFTAGLAAVRALLRASHLATVTESENATIYRKVFALQSDPVYHGPNGVEQLLWTFNVEMWAHEAP